MSLITEYRSLNTTEPVADVITQPQGWRPNDQVVISGDFVGQESFYLPVAARSNQFAVLHWRFYAKGETESRCLLMMGVLPELNVPVYMDLNWLDGQSVFMPRSPGRLKATCIGRRIRAEELDRVEITLMPPVNEIACKVGPVVTLAEGEDLPVLETKVLCDRFGQWAAWDWPEKVKSEEELKACLDHFESAPEPCFTSRGQYGGWTEKTFEATGYFRALREKGTWWLVDPDGHAFISAGLDCVSPGIAGAIVPGTEGLYEGLDELLKNMNGRESGWGHLSVDHMSLNLRRHWGEDDKPRWRKAIAGQMKQWGFNTIGNWSDLKVGQDHGMPYVFNMPKYPTTETLLFRDLPDVYDPAFQANAEAWAQNLTPTKDDPLLIGYFMTNEPQWGFGTFNLAAEMLEQHPGTYSRRAFAEFLRTRYEGDDKRLSEAWEGRVQGFAEIENAIIQRVDVENPTAEQDCWDFSRQLVERFVGIPAKACKAVDANHLNLGMRWAWIASDLCYVGAEHYDVFAINCYSFKPDEELLAGIDEHTGLPVMIGEYHFGALDRGLTGNGLKGVINQEERGVAYRHFFEFCASDPRVIGAHYFTLYDQHCLGRFDGENWQIGLMDVTQQPYEPLIKACQHSHEHMYRIRCGEREASQQLPVEVERIAL